MTARTDDYDQIVRVVQRISVCRGVGGIFTALGTIIMSNEKP